jgi:DeoR/GlpR family transcriptional regulator of sugar metabolism
MKKDPPSTTTFRRKFILDTVVRERRALRLEELRNRFAVNNQSVLDDVIFLNKLGFDIKRVRRGREVELVDGAGNAATMVELREDLQFEEKKIAAWLMAGIVCGFPPDETAATVADAGTKGSLRKRGDVDARKYPYLAQCASRAEIRAILAQSKSRCRSNYPRTFTKAHEILLQLEDFWRIEQSRVIAVDCGTTNRRLMDILKYVDIPCPFTSMSSLTVCTNDRKIFEMIGVPSVSIRTIICGGQQRLLTESIAGALAELFLRTAATLQFGIAIVGSAVIDLSRHACCSDSQEEAAIKTLMFQKSTMRIVLVDNTKLVRKPMREAYRFATLNPEQIDVIVVNKPLRVEDLPGASTSDEREHQRRVAKEFPSLVESIEERGVPVLVADRNIAAGVISAEDRKN